MTYAPETAARSTLPEHLRNLSLPDRIRTVRKLKGYNTQAALAVALGTRRVQVNHWETGRHLPSRKWAEQLAELLGGQTSDWLEEGRAPRQRAEAALADAALNLSYSADEIVGVLVDLRSLVSEIRTLVAELVPGEDASPQP